MKSAKRGISGISPVISTIIISGTLLIILIASSYVATNILELQVSNTEFEQAKASMLLLDEVIQDVASKPGSGGYIQFNQRSGGINIIESEESLKIIGPANIEIINPPIQKSPTSQQGQWNNGEGALYLDSSYAYSNNNNEQHEFWGFGFTVPSSAKIVSVRIGVSAKAGKNQPDQIKLEVKIGDSYLPKTEETTTIREIESTIWIDVSSWASWKPADLSTIGVRVTHVKRGSVDTVYINHIVVEVTYSTIILGEVIYESPSLVNIFYRGGSKVSGAGAVLRGSPSLIVDETGSMSYLRVETGDGVHIKLDYHRVRVINYGVQVGGGRLTNVTVIVFYKLTRGETGGQGAINVKVRNTFNIQTITREYNNNTVNIRIQLGQNKSENITLKSQNPRVTTTVIVKVIEVLISTA
ncbi:MAG: hypothetical protein QXX41_02395 [Nitrososphaerota archaeon]